MKTREWVMFGVIILLVIALMQRPPENKPRFPLLRALLNLGGILRPLFFGDEEPADQEDEGNVEALPTYRSLDTATANQEPIREFGANGIPLLDHGAGW